MRLPEVFLSIYRNFELPYSHLFQQNGWLVRRSVGWLVGCGLRHFQHKQAVSCHKERLQFVEGVYFG